jgi:hypothetical protein
MAASPPPDSFWNITNWGPVEWLIGAAWAAGLVVVGFVWSMGHRIGVIETRVQERHEENLRGRKELLDRIDRLESAMKEGLSEVRDLLYRALGGREDRR